MKRLVASARMVATELRRNRTAVTFLFLVPTVLYALIQITTGERLVPFLLSGRGTGPLAGSERTLSLLFMGMTAMGGLMAFLAFTLTWRPIATDRRLVFEGFRPAELLGAKALVLAAAATAVALYVTALLLALYRPERLGGVFVGFLLGGLIYGVLGLLIGTLCRRELDGILAILLLVNVDPGWLQNPVFYAEAQNQAVIRWLPSHHACQIAMMSAFTARPLARELMLGGAWLLALALAAALAYRLRLGLVRRREVSIASTARL